MPIWFRVNGGNWNNNPSANPATQTGGISLAGIANQPTLPVLLQGPGTTRVNFGGSAFSFAVPAGFAAGWPASGGGTTTLASSQIVGPGVTLSGGDLTCNSVSVSGSVTPALADALVAGSYYFEWTSTRVSLFANNIGMGVMVIGADSTGVFSSRASYDGLNDNGGARINSNAPTIADSDIYANGVLQINNFDHLNVNDVYSIAVTLEGTVPVSPTVDISDTYFQAGGGFINLADLATRRAFVSADGCTPDLGDAGATPTGSSPTVFFSALPAGNAAGFATNQGSGGTFAASGGSLTLSGSRPCCTVTTTPQADLVGEDPQVMLTLSDDAGVTWEALQKWRSMGRMGEYNKRLRWLKLGQARQRSIRLEVTDPVRRNFIGFFLDTEEGME